jgi:uncharacterized membrane protein
MTAEESGLVRLERHLGRVLIAGVIASAIALAAGLSLFLVSPGVLSGRLLTTGLIILMATPMLRVVVSAAEYVRMRDWFFVATTLVVLAELAVTVLYSLSRLQRP